MNVGMMACYDQAKEIVGKITNDPMEKGPNLTTQLGSSAIAVSYSYRYISSHRMKIIFLLISCFIRYYYL